MKVAPVFLFVFRGCVHLHIYALVILLMEEILHLLRLVVYPTMYRVSTSQVVQDFFHTQCQSQYWRSPQDRNIFSVCAAVAAHVLAPVGCERFWQHSRCRNWWLTLRLGRWVGWRCSIYETWKWRTEPWRMMIIKYDDDDDDDDDDDCCNPGSSMWPCLLIWQSRSYSKAV